MTTITSQLSDFEINKRMMELNGMVPLDFPHNADGKSVGTRTGQETIRWYDYLSEWQYTGPMMIANEIALLPIKNQWACHIGVREFRSTNPLRAVCLAIIEQNKE